MGGRNVVQSAAVAFAVASALLLCTGVAAESDDAALESKTRIFSEFNSFPSVLDSDLANWKVDGQAKVDASKKRVELTPPELNTSGYIYNTHPVKSRDWEAIVKFTIDGTNEISDSEGIAFWFIQNPKKSLFNGTRNNFVGLGVFFDTFDDHLQANNSFIWAMTNDGTKSYGHQHAEYDDEEEPAACIMDFRNRPDVFAKISYYDGTLSVEVDQDNSGTYTSCFQIQEIELLPNLHFALSAANGQFNDAQSVSSFSVHYLEDPEDEQSKIERQKMKKQIESLQDDLAKVNKNLEETHRQNEIAKQRAAEAPAEGDAAPHPVLAQLESLLRSHLEKDLENQKISLEAYERVFKYEEEVEKRRSHFQDNAATALQGLQVELHTTQKKLKEISASLVNAGVTAPDTHEKLSSIEDRLMDKLKMHTNHIEKLSDNVQTLKHGPAQGRERVPIGPEIENMTKDLNTLKLSLEASHSRQQEMAQDLEKKHNELNETIQATSGIGFWTYFVFIQVAFGFGYIFWRKYQDDQKSHLF